MLQDKLVEKAHISKNYLSDIEPAKSHGSLDTYYRIACALQVTLNHLVYGELSVNSLAELLDCLPENKKELVRKFILLL